MSKDQIEEAQALADDWKPKTALKSKRRQQFIQCTDRPLSFAKFSVIVSYAD
jgi:hypothetical protein